ncbi:hypothetical protein HPB51_011789 [Rhipicephalus microplus]|uniref:Uncharacterized protein n=1 Tax=Rhipicephalus microplus TaxID=6941 RepID=A0A9J6DG85_RHIMP|nr:hypothetical protein HPB51_011789 [Rhipicephalus microplus]
MRALARRRGTGFLRRYSCSPSSRNKIKGRETRAVVSTSSPPRSLQPLTCRPSCQPIDALTETRATCRRCRRFLGDDVAVVSSKQNQQVTRERALDTASSTQKVLEAKPHAKAAAAQWSRRLLSLSRFTLAHAQDDRRYRRARPGPKSSEERLPPKAAPAAKSQDAKAGQAGRAGRGGGSGGTGGGQPSNYRGHLFAPPAEAAGPP